MQICIVIGLVFISEFYLVGVSFKGILSLLLGLELYLSWYLLK